MDIKSLFHVSQWDVAFRRVKSETCFDFLSKGLKPEFTPIKDTKDYSFADPLFYSDEEGNYLFVEAINKKTRKGSLGVFDFNSGLGKYHDILEEDFHLSYPLVFKIRGGYYLMPESNNAHKLLLYRAVEYPYKWELFKVLIDGIDCVDTTIYEKESSIYLLSYVKSKPYNKLTIFRMNDDFSVSKIEEIEDINESLRGAGHFLAIGGKEFRPSQYCKDTYGHYLVFNRVDSECPAYRELQEFRFLAKDFSVAGVNSKSIYKVHTYSTGEGYEFIDYMHWRFSLFKPVKKVLHKFCR